MSATFYYPPVKKTKTLDRAVLHALERSGLPFPTILTISRDERFLAGLVAAEVAGAKELYDAVEKHGEVRVWKEH